MRRSLAKIPYPVIGRAATTTTNSSISAAFSTSSGDGRGRGRGVSIPSQFSVNENQSDNSKNDEASPLPHGHGRGRGQPLPSFSFINNDSKPLPVGRGRGFTPPNSTLPPPQEESESAKVSSKMPFLVSEDNSVKSEKPTLPRNIFNVLSSAGRGKPSSVNSEASTKIGESLPGHIINNLSGAGRGKPLKLPEEKPTVENRHVRPRQQQQPAKPPAGPDSVDESSPRVQLNQVEKVKNAVEILSKGGGERRGREGSVGGGGGDPSPRASGGRGGRGGRGGGPGRPRGGGPRRPQRGQGDVETDEDEEGALYMGDDADGERMAQKLGPDIMNQVDEALDEVFDRVLPSPLNDAIVDAQHTNFLLECDPQYHMEEFGTNPDIDEKPPISLRDALEKMKPFLMKYEGIESHEEWEKIMEELMKTTVPLMKEIVDHYSGPDRVTAKQQQEELERVAKTLPASAPASVKRFTDRALLSLQSNPGWGFDKKGHFMGKLIKEVSQQYK